MNLRRAVEALRRDVAAARAAAGLSWSVERVDGADFTESGWLLKLPGGGQDFVFDQAPDAATWCARFRFLRDRRPARRSGGSGGDPE